MVNFQDEFDVIDYEAGVDNEIRGRECRCCFRLLKWNFYRRDSSSKDGYALQCYKCEASPKMSMAEHTSRLREENFNSHGTKRQRHVDQTEMRRDRKGVTLHSSDFLQRLHKICPRLYVTQGGIIGDLALYVTSGQPRPEWDERDFKYLGYVTLGLMPEFSTYEFDDERDIMVKSKDMGWRSVLIRFIENKILTEEQCNEEFGPPSSGISATWHKRISQLRNNK